MYGHRCIVSALHLLMLAAAASATPLYKAYDLQGPGLSVAQAGVGLEGLGGGDRALTIEIGGPVELALLYWAGRDRPCAPDPEGEEPCAPFVEPYRDQLLLLDGIPIRGSVSGTEVQPATSRGPIRNIGYVAEVTEAVRAKGTGQLTFAVADADRTSNLADLNGAGLLLVYTDPAKPAAARVIVFHGLDFAYGEDRTPGETQVTQAVTFVHGAALRTARRGELVLFAADDAGDRGPERIDISNNKSLYNVFDGSAGARWDSDRLPIDIPAGVHATAVQVFSQPVGQNPDSLFWITAALRVPLPVHTGCSDQFWLGNQKEWRVTGIATTQRVKHVFSASVGYGLVGEAILTTALRFRSDGGLLGMAKMLVRAGTAALINSVHPAIEYPYTRTQVITLVNSALNRGDANAIAELTEELERANAADCPLE